MQKPEYTLRFTTPAFLGNAQQAGQWRTPPFKALLRQWWRVVWAAGHDPRDTDTLRQEEARLFGTAGTGSDSRQGARQSAVRLRLDSWKHGKFSEKYSGGSELGYLGYGPANTDRSAISPDETAVLSIAVPDDRYDSILATVMLMNQYGTLGSRSRNGWGSVLFESDPPSARIDLSRFFKPWREALGICWPHTLGMDEQRLVWETEPKSTWEEAMRLLYQIRRGVNRHVAKEDRKLLSSPVKGNTDRIPNSLRFKVRPHPSERNQFQGIVFHMPCTSPKVRTDRRAVEKVWQQVHGFLDCPDLVKVPLSRTDA